MTTTLQQDVADLRRRICNSFGEIGLMPKLEAARLLLQLGQCTAITAAILSGPRREDLEGALRVSREAQEKVARTCHSALIIAMEGDPNVPAKQRIDAAIDFLLGEKNA